MSPLRPASQDVCILSVHRVLCAIFQKAYRLTFSSLLFVWAATLGQYAKRCKPEYDRKPTYVCQGQGKKTRFKIWKLTGPSFSTRIPYSKARVEGYHGSLSWRVHLHFQFAWKHGSKEGSLTHGCVALYSWTSLPKEGLTIEFEIAATLLLCCISRSKGVTCWVIEMQDDFWCLPLF